MHMKLPEPFESEYKSKYLKNKIKDVGMWFKIPAVRGDINSPSGIQRLKQNGLLFRFLDTYFPNGRYAFEPNMQDGRFVLLPDNVGHQGMGISVSLSHPDHLEIGHFWYPSEYSSRRDVPLGTDQVYVCNFMLIPNEALAGFVRKHMMRPNEKTREYCTFPFDPYHVLTLTGRFMDKKEETIKKIRDFLQDAGPAVKRNGEGLVYFIENY